MRLTAILALLLGLVLAGGSVVLAHAWLQNANQGPDEAASGVPEVQIVDIVVADIDIIFGQAIDGGMVRLQRWPKEALPDGVFTQLEDLLGDGSEAPRRARKGLSAGEPVTAARVSAFGEKVTMADALDPAKRAMAIRVDDVTGVAGFVTPGDRVDIILTRRLDNDEMRADTILQHIVVRGIDQVADEENEQPAVVRTVTVEVTPEEAQKLTLAQQAGTLSLTLRNLSSGVDAKLSSIRLRDLVQDTESRAGRPQVTVIRGGVRSPTEVRGD